MEILRTVKFDPGAPQVSPDVVCFETGATPEQTVDESLCVYEHHGDGFGLNHPGALTRFFEDMVAGRPMPSEFVTRRMDVDTIVAMVLFLHRDLVMHPKMTSVVASVDLVHRWGDPFFAHVEYDLFRLMRFTQKAVSGPNVVPDAIRWVREYVMEDRLPSLPPASPLPTVLDVGTNGFVLAETPGDMHEGWIELFRQGHLRGLLVSRDHNGVRHVVAARKSPMVQFDLSRAALILNQMESAMGELPEWRVEGPWLYSPERGTEILVSHLLEVFLRV